MSPSGELTTTSLNKKSERGEARTPNQWVKRYNQTLKRAENPFVRGIFRDKMANFHVHCVHKLQGFHAHCNQ